MERYYGMLLKCLAWINGKALEQYEGVKPVVKFSLLGPAATDYPGPIRCKSPFAAAASCSHFTAALVVEAGQRRVC